jgi:hypothetical protein
MILHQDGAGGLPSGRSGPHRVGAGTQTPWDPADGVCTTEALDRSGTAAVVTVATPRSPATSVMTAIARPRRRLTHGSYRAGPLGQPRPDPSVLAQRDLASRPGAAQSCRSGPNQLRDAGQTTEPFSLRGRFPARLAGEMESSAEP